MSLGGWAGWALGAQFSFFAAFLLSVVGTAGGLYLARRLVKSLS